MRNNYLLIPIVTVCLASFGCGGRESAIAGLWTASDAKFGGLDGSGFSPEMLKGKLGLMTLDLKQDRHFDMAIENGTWSLDDDKVILKVASFGGKTPEQMRNNLDKKESSLPLETRAQAENAFQDEQVGKLSPDGKTMTLVIGPITFILKKKSP